MSTESSVANKDPAYYRSKRAKSGLAFKKKEFIGKFSFYHSCYQHSVILCSGTHPRPEWVVQKEENKKKMEEYRQLLEMCIIDPSGEL
jgi:hypothetical protein